MHSMILKAFGKTVEDALRFGFYLDAPASVGLAVIAQPSSSSSMSTATFNAASTSQNRAGIAGYTIGLAGYSAIKDSRALLLCDAAAAI